MKALLLSILVLAMMAVSGGAQESPELGRRQEVLRHGAAIRSEGMYRGGGEFGGLGQRRQMFLETPTDDQWAVVAKFMEEQLPNSWKMFERIPVGAQRRDDVKRQMYARYRDLEQFRGRDDVYEQKLAQAKLADEAIGLAAKLKEASPDQHPALRQQLRDKVRQRIQAEFTERQLRIDRLADQLKKEQQKLESARADETAELERRVNTLIKGGGMGGPRRDRQGAERDRPAAPSARDSQASGDAG